MDIYSRKSNQKMMLLVLAIVIALLTTLYTNYLTRKIEREEKLKAKLWAEAIASKAQLVKYTNELFTRLSVDERKKVAIWAQSIKFVTTLENTEELNFFTSVITDNTDIPVILTDDQGAIIDYRNFTISTPKDNFNINNNEFAAFRTYEPIAVSYTDRKNYIYYKDSNLFSELKKTLNNLISSFISEVVVNTASAPVLLTDEKLKVLASGNIDSSEISSAEKVQQMILQMEAKHEPILVDLGEGNKKKIYFDDSLILKQLKVFPYIQLGIFALFLFFSYFAFSNARKAEQNLVWVGMAKETAHQLGTPISSLAAWIEYLKDSDGFKDNPTVVKELEADVDRLTLVADRFSKIGSKPQLSEEKLKTVLERNIEYMQKRSSKEVHFNLYLENEDMNCYVNNQLFDWVLENLFKNALDAMNGEGEIDVQTSTDSSNVIIDITDTGCGIPRNKHQTIFEPGFSTKRRGWGLGLSLTKRIVEDYHNGKIMVKESEIGKGTTFRILLPKG